MPLNSLQLANTNLQTLTHTTRSREKRKAIPLLRHLLMTAPIRTSNVTAWFALEMAAVIGPLQQRLALPRSAERIARLTSAANLDSMAAKRPPAADLPLVLRAEPPARVVAAIPLEPASGIVRVDPAFRLPLAQRRTGPHSVVVERAVGLAPRKLGLGVPLGRELSPAVGHVLAAEHAKGEHLGRRQFGFEGRCEVTAHRRRAPVTIALLHAVVDENLVSRRVLIRPVERVRIVRSE